MAKTYKFDNKSNVEILDPDEGSFETTFEGTVEYCFDRDDKTLRLENRCWFRVEDIDSFINFLKAAREKLTK